MSKDPKITSLFERLTAKKSSDTNGYKNDEDDDDDMEMVKVIATGDGKKKKKKMSIERIYQKKTQLEHILLRPDTYIGSVEKATQPMWVYDEASEGMIQRDITYVPGLYKIYDEILVNAADNKQRDPHGMTSIRIEINPEQNRIQIWNNGKGIPVVEHATEKVFVPTLIFGQLLTSSNYNDDEKKVTGGRNGYGAKLCNIFSTKFVLETSCREFKKCFKQTWSDNMTKTNDPVIGPNKSEDYTSITFYPDLTKFKMDRMDEDMVDLFKRRAYDMVATSKGVKIFLNGKKLQIKNFRDYVDLFVKNKQDENEQPLKVVYESVSDRWDVALVLSDKGFQQVSFVNSIATTKGGKHVDYITDQVVTDLLEIIKKKEKKAGISVKAFQVKNHLWMFVNCLVENPTFDSQTKENMTLQAKNFGSKCKMSEKFYAAASKSGVIEAIQTWMRFKQQTQLNQKSGAKRSKLKGIPKLDDANDAGSKNSMDCTLILTEGDSAKTLAVAGLGVVGRDRYGVFPLKGKVLNVRDALHKQIMENAEINNIIKIIGLQYRQKYDSPESLKSLRYGRLMIMTDQDQDGSHIKGLLINFIHHNWPHLLHHRFLEEFITPIVKVTRAKQEKSFYSLPEFEEWKSNTDNWHLWKIKYYKGLGTSTAKEAREYFSEMTRHRIPFKYVGAEDDSALILAFSKKKIEERKQWLTNWMESRKRRAAIGMQQDFLYGKDTKYVTYNEFVNKELILFSNMDNERSIPSLVDGCKPGQRKVMFTCLKRNLVKEIKVAQLAGSVSEMSAYHHGEASLMATIIGLAQNYVGSNNLNLLQPLGQFGTRLNGGKDSASPRYIFTCLSTLTRHVYNANDEALLRYNQDDNVRIEPEWFIPIIPMVLANGAEGIGTGWSTKVPNYDLREIVSNIRLMIDGREPVPMIPSFKNFRGSIEYIDNTKCVSNGEISILDDNTLEISELPVRVWTQAYKENVLEPMMLGTDKIPAVIQDYKEYHTDLTVRFVIKITPENIRKAEHFGMHRFFKLQTTFSTNSMVLFDGAGCIRRFETVEEIFKEFFELRMEFYKRRKDFLEGMLAAESLKLNNQARFICEKIDKVISIENMPKRDLIKLLEQRGYDSDPVKKWKKIQSELQNQSVDPEGDADGENADPEATSDFNYILSMQLWSLTKEKKDELLKQRDDKADQLYQLKKKSPTDLWTDDLDAFVVELDKVEAKEKEDANAVDSHPTSGKARGRGSKKQVAMETKPSQGGIRVMPSTEALRNKLVAAKGAAMRKRKKTEEDQVDDGADNRSLAERLGVDSDTQKKLLAKKGKPKPRERKKAHMSDSDEEEEDEDDIILDDDDSDEDAFKPSPPKKQKLAKEAMKEEKDEKKDEKKSGKGEKKGKEKKGKNDDEVVVKKKVAKKRMMISDDEDEDGGMSWMENKKSSPAKKSGEDADDYEDEDMVDEYIPLRERLGRSKKPAAFKFGDDDEDEDDED